MNFWLLKEKTLAIDVQRFICFPQTIKNPPPPENMYP